MSDAVAKFVEAIGQSLSTGNFVKLTLSNYRGAEEHLQKVSARPVETKKGTRVFFQYRYDRRDVAKNYGAERAIRQVRDLLDSGFRSGHLFTTSNDYQLTVGKRSSRIVVAKPTFEKTPSTAHDREKKTRIDPGAFYLRMLGISTDKGEIRAQQQHKWRQINKYVEILDGLFERSALKDRTELRIVDMGSGKGYLTFAAYDYFTNVRGLSVEMTGVDAEEKLVDFCNQVAESGGFNGLRFVKGSILDFEVAATDILIALHACDTATDDALYKGITAAAEIIVAAPCCHKEVRRQMKPPELLTDILKHGTMLEREAETITDGLRSMLLERSGYETRVFEFVPTEHTPKNNMIAAVRNASKSPGAEVIQERIDAVKAFYAITDQRLGNLLA